MFAKQVMIKEFRMDNEGMISQSFKTSRPPSPVIRVVINRIFMLNHTKQRLLFVVLFVTTEKIGGEALICPGILLFLF